MTSKDASEPAKNPKTPPSTAGMTTKVVKGSLWTLAGQVAPLAVSLVATPFVIRMLGAESYGVLILIGLIPTYLGFADFGMSMASTKFGSEAYAEGDEEKEARIVRTAALIALITSVPVAAALIIFASPVIALFNVPEALQAEAATALRIAAVTFVSNFLCGIFNTPQLARLRMDLNTFINAGSRILGLIATPIVLYLGYGIIGAVTVLLAASLLNLLGHLVFSRQLLPAIFGLSVSRYHFRPFFRFGLALVGASAAALLLANFEKGFLPRVTSTAELAYYSVAFTFAGMLTLFAGSLSQSLIPAFSQLQNESEGEKLNLLFQRAVKFNLLWLVLFVSISSIFAEEIIGLWAGTDFSEYSIVPYYILLLGLLFNIPAYVPYAVIMAKGRTDLFAKVYWIELFPYLTVVTVLVTLFGAKGAAIAWSTRVAVDAVILFWLAARIGKLTLAGIRINRLLVALILGAIPLGVHLAYDVPLLLRVGLSIIIAIAFFIYVFWTVFDRSEAQWVRDRLFLRSARADL